MFDKKDSEVRAQMGIRLVIYFFWVFFVAAIFWLLNYPCLAYSTVALGAVLIGVSAWRHLLRR
jgi:hypothetical protein